jgi:hypothetical protein
MKTALRRILPAIVVVLLLAPAFVKSAPPYYSKPGPPIVLTLVAGWWSSAQRFHESWNAKWTDAALWAPMALFALLLMHSMLRWLSNRPAWRMRSTFAVLALLGVLLLFAMSAVGIAHQTAWWFGSGEPKWKDTNAVYLTPLVEAIEAEEAVHELATKRSQIPAADLRAAISRDSRRFYETMYVTVFEDGNGIATGALLVPRERRARGKIGCVLLTARKGWSGRLNPVGRIDGEDVDALLSHGTGLQSIDGQIPADDTAKLSTALQELGVDPKPFVERLFADGSADLPPTR